MDLKMSQGDYIMDSRVNGSQDQNAGIQERLNLKEPHLRAFPLFRSLSLDTKNKIQSLRQLQLEQAEIQRAKDEEIHGLKLKYADISSSIFKERKLIIAGDTGNANCKVNGVSDFWLTVFLNSRTLSCLIEDEDKPILKHLQDITVNYAQDSWDFVLEFYFESNDYFNNNSLTKEYYVRQHLGPNDPYGLKNGSIYDCRGCVIEWKPNRCVLDKTTKTTAEVVRRKSFFSFFTHNGRGEPNHEATDLLLKEDFYVGQYLKDVIVPNAYLFYIMEFESDLSEKEYRDTKIGRTCVVV